MRMTVEIPDRIFRRAKSSAAEQGILVRQFVAEAIEEKLRPTPGNEQKPWMKHMGKLKDLHKGTERINKIIEGAFEQIDPEMWMIP